MQASRPPLCLRPALPAAQGPPPAPPHSTQTCPPHLQEQTQVYAHQQRQQERHAYGLCCTVICRPKSILKLAQNSKGVIAPLTHVLLTCRDTCSNISSMMIGGSCCAVACSPHHGNVGLVPCNNTTVGSAFKDVTHAGAKAPLPIQNGRLPMPLVSTHAQVNDSLVHAITLRASNTCTT